jgi:hypothetical protein
MWMAIREFAKETEQAERLMAEQAKRQEAAGMMMVGQQQQQQVDSQTMQMANQNQQAELQRQHDMDKLVVEKALDNGNVPRELQQR